jgi:hypothetical protein
VVLDLLRAQMLGIIANFDGDALTHGDDIKAKGVKAKERRKKEGGLRFVRTKLYKKQKEQTRK